MGLRIFPLCWGEVRDARKTQIIREKVELLQWCGWEEDPRDNDDTGAHI